MVSDWRTEHDAAQSALSQPRLEHNSVERPEVSATFRFCPSPLRTARLARRSVKSGAG
jgi:hypothetical protein